MNITEVKQNQIVILAVAGRLDAISSPILQQKFQDLLKENEKKIVVDFSELKFIASAGLGVLLGAALSAKRTHAQIALCGLTEHVKYIFDTAGFTMLFSIFATQEQAIQLF